MGRGGFECHAVTQKCYSFLLVLPDNTRLVAVCDYSGRQYVVTCAASVVVVLPVQVPIRGKFKVTQ